MAAVRASRFPYPVRPIQDILSRAARELPGKVAVIDGDRRFTYRELDDYSSRFAAALAALGVAKGDRVGIMAPNCTEFEIAFFGIVRAGAVATTLNSAYQQREIAHQINDSGAETLIVHEALAGIAKEAQDAQDATPDLRRLIVIKPTSEDPQSFWGLLENAPAKPPSVSINPMEDLAALPYSSGTTGLSKGVMLTHHNLTTNLEQFTHRPGEGASYRRDDVFLVHLPLFHIYGLQILMNAVIQVGATQVLMGRFDMQLFLNLVAQHRVTQLYTVPPVGLGLTQYPGISQVDLTSLRVGFLAAAPCSQDLQYRVSQVLNCPVIQGYGMTELSPVVNIDFMEADRFRSGAVGPVLADTEERVVDLEDGATELPLGEVGELLVRGPQVMKGYHNNPQATAETITADGWLRTGDIVRMERDGNIWILDRKKELIKYKGFQVPPAELEGLLLEHPGVADAAVIGKPDVESGEIPKAFVVRKSGTDLSAQDLMGFVSGQVATFKQVREVEFVDSIPKNPSGKILRRLLLEQERAKVVG